MMFYKQLDSSFGNDIYLYSAFYSCSVIIICSLVFFAFGYRSVSSFSLSRITQQGKMYNASFYWSHLLFLLFLFQPKIYLNTSPFIHRNVYAYACARAVFLALFCFYPICIGQIWSRHCSTILILLFSIDKNRVCTYKKEVIRRIRVYIYSEHCMILYSVVYFSSSSSICCKYKNCSFSFFCYLKKVNHFVLLRQAILK